VTPAEQRVVKAFVSDCTVGGQYYWSQERLARRSYVKRETANRALQRLAGGLDLLHIPEKQRHFHHPKTISLRPWVLTRVLGAVLRALRRIEDHTRKPQASVEEPDRQLVLPSLQEILPCFRRKRRYGGGWMVRCPCHDDRTPSLSLAEGDGGKLIWFCHAGCRQYEVGQALCRAFPVTLFDRWQAEQREFARRLGLGVAA
jgi:hypothetical protein